MVCGKGKKNYTKGIAKACCVPTDRAHLLSKPNVSDTVSSVMSVCVCVCSSHLFQRSSSSPPQPQNALGNPLIFLNCFTVMPLTPPKNSLYGSLQGTITYINFVLSKGYIDGAYAYRDRIQGSHVGVLVKFDRKVSGHVGAAVVVSVVLHEVVHVVEDQTVPVKVLHGLLEADIEQHGSVKRLCAPLKKNKMRYFNIISIPFFLGCHAKACFVRPFQPAICCKTQTLLLAENKTHYQQLFGLYTGIYQLGVCIPAQ